MKPDITLLIGGYPILRIGDLFKWRSEFCHANVEEKLHISAAKVIALTAV